MASAVGRPRCALHEAVLTPSPKGATDYIILQSSDSDLKICCARNWTSLVKAVETRRPQPFAQTKEQARNKLTAWVEKQELGRRLAQTQLQLPTRSVDGADQPAMEPVLEGTSAMKGVFATTKDEAVQRLVKLGYSIASPRTATLESRLASPAGMTTPPPYTFRPS
ncbi:hypothetical protein LTR49_025818 [Elasticomyces elasticus]|nr:hypothetical protein LTR49_025818 [Elasticomyces elasticus]